MAFDQIHLGSVLSVLISLGELPDSVCGLMIGIVMGLIFIGLERLYYVRFTLVFHCSH